MERILHLHDTIEVVDAVVGGVLLPADEEMLGKPVVPDVSAAHDAAPSFCNADLGVGVDLAGTARQNLKKRVEETWPSGGCPT